MNKKILITFVSIFAGTMAYTTFAFAEGLNVGVSLSAREKVELSDKNKHENKVKAGIKSNFSLFEKREENRENKKDRENKKEDKKKNESPQTDAEKMAALKARGVKEIDTRIALLTNLNVRVANLINVSTATKATIATNIQTQIASLVVLKAKINADNDLSVLKNDVKSIQRTSNFLGFFMSHKNLLARMENHFATLNKLATTTIALGTDIQTAQTSGKDVASLRAKLTSANTKLADANVQSNLALSLVAPLVPDMGSSTVRTANKQIIVDAHAKYKVALQDIKEVKTYIKEIVKQLKDWGVTITAKTDTKVKTQ